MKLKIKTNPYRLFFQLAIIAILILMILKLFIQKSYTADFEAYCPFGGIMAFTSFLVNNSLACSMTSVQIAMGIALVIAVIIFSKLFCSYICPVGTISEWLGKIGDKFKMRFTITGYGDILLRGLKYAILFITIYYSVTSSELFCKKIDPYYASLSGFSTDVSLVWAIITISILLFGSFFIRLFWCKYLCPLGAISNIFMFFFLFLGITAIYLILIFFGIHLSFVWPLALMCSLAYFLEFYRLKSRYLPLLRIRRNEEICTNCKLCTKVCPQAIDVASLKVVKHIDCHLCSDCIHVCPEAGALTINKKGRKWLPAIIVLVLIISGFVAGRSFEVPTISLYWGDNARKDEMKTFVRSGLRSVKCFGSSTTFANQMKRVNGVTGVTTFVKSNTVKIMYDPAGIDTTAILKSIFTPVKMQIRKPGNEIVALDLFKLRVDNFLDAVDEIYFKQLLSQDKDIIGFTTEFDCPVRINVYTNSASKFDIKKLKDLIQYRELQLSQAGGKILIVPLRFRVTGIDKEAEQVSKRNYLESMYYGFSRNFSTDAPELYSKYTVIFPGGGTEATNLMLDKLTYHLSLQPGIKAVESVLSGGEPKLIVYFDKNQTNEKTIHTALNSSSILSPGANGITVNISNPLSFPFKGETMLKK